MKTKGITAWVVFWSMREDKVDKRTGTIVCLLPRRYSPKRVRDILDGIYLSYIKTFDGHLEFATSQTEKSPMLAEISRYSDVYVSKNPGLHAWLCHGVKVSSKKMVQTITWTTPTNYRRNDRHEIVEEIPGKTYRYTFDFCKMVEVRSDLPKC